MQIAQYKTQHGSILVLEANKYNESPDSTLVRMTEILTVEFTPLKDTSARELVELRRSELTASRALDDIRSRIAKLQPQEDVA